MYTYPSPAAFHFWHLYACVILTFPTYTTHETGLADLWQTVGAAVDFSARVQTMNTVTRFP